MTSHTPDNCHPLFYCPSQSRLDGGKAKDRPDRAVFLDRDGIVIQDVGYLCKPSDLKLLRGSVEGIKRLQEHFLIIIVTNQSAVARGHIDVITLEHIHCRLSEQLHEAGAQLDGVYACPHHPSEGCSCRKPEPGMLYCARDRFGIDIRSSFMVGDKSSDILAGQRAHVTGTVLIPSRKTPLFPIPGIDPNYEAPDLCAAADWILEKASIATASSIPHRPAMLLAELSPTHNVEERIETSRPAEPRGTGTD